MTEVLRTTLGGLLDEKAAALPDREALVDLSTAQGLTFAQWAAETDLLARGLMALGLEPGHHLALWGGSSVEWILTQYAAAKAGVVVVSADPDYDQDQIAYLLEQSEAESLVVFGGYKDRDFAEVIARLCPEVETAPAGGLKAARLPALKNLLLCGQPPRPGFYPWSELREMARKVSAEELARRRAQVAPADVTLISYTSGTTGAPKGVMCTHEGLINKSLQAALIQGLSPEDRVGLCVPLYHMFGNTCALLTALTCGAALVLFGQYYQTGQALRGLAEGECSILYGAPSQFIGMMEHPLFGQVDLSRLRGGIMGGAPCPMEVMKKVVEEMGVREILVGFGQTEASSWVTLTRPDDPLEVRVSTIGRPFDHVEVKIVDPQTGEEVPPGTPGELCTRGFLMAGYYNMPAATAKALDAEGWLHTGDLVAQDEEGNFRIMGRLKDLITREGAEIAPTDIEEVLYTHPDIVEAAAFGLPAQGGQEEVAVWVKPREGARLTPEEVIAFCAGQLPAHSVPTVVQFTDSFPMTPTGKIQKFKMREMTAARQKEQG